MAKMIHAMIRVMDEERSLRFYEQALGLKVVERIDFETFTLVYLGNEETAFELELTVNKGHEASYELGNGYGHLAVSVDDLAAEHARLLDLGLEPRKIVHFGADGTVIARFFFIKDPDGYEIEVLQRAGRYL